MRVTLRLMLGSDGKLSSLELSGGLPGSLYVGETRGAMLVVVHVEVLAVVVWRCSHLL